jgi:hypothetical protein
MVARTWFAGAVLDFSHLTKPVNTGPRKTDIVSSLDTVHILRALLR